MKREHYLSDGKRTIVWMGEKCVHKAFCLRSIVAITDTKGLTLHNISQAQYGMLANQAKICPSGALKVQGKV